MNQKSNVNYAVDPNNDCKLILGKDEIKDGWTYRMFDTKDWGKITFTLFSMFVSVSFLASFDPTSFYLGIVLLVGTYIRPIFLYGTWRGFIYEATHTDAIMKLLESVYMKRHEEDLMGEEENYRMIQEILRCPELFKAITGSSLRGSCDPIMDKMQPEDITKLEHLNMLERKGFDVEDLKKKLIEKTGKIKEIYDN